jgi:TP901 family phage tail tape measure protein
MPKKALASLNVVITAVTSPLFKGLARASKRLIAFGGQMKAVGRSISMSFALPFAAVGVAGAKMAIDFEKNMTKINTLVGISGKEVNAMGAEVMKLSGATAQAPADLADGLFFLTSAGLRGANAMSTLEAVSKGVAIGLGEQGDLAKVAAAAQNAYGADTLTAAQALDVFGKTVQTGMFEASDLTEVLGTQLGMSSSLGISFQEASAFIATYTKTTGDAKAASTSFGGVMMALAKTTPQMEKALKKVGMSGDSVRASLGENGLRQTLINIKTAFEEQGVPLTQFFSKSQALKGVLGVLGNQTETYGEILEDMGDSAGMVEEGFETLSQTTGFKMQKSFNTLKNAAMQLGATLMPVFTAIVNGAVNLGKAFTDLDGGTKKLLVGSAALLAFSGPLMTVGGTLLTVMGALISPIGLVVVAIGALFAVIVNNWGTVKTVFVSIINYFINLYNESIIFRGAVQLIIAVFKNLWTQIKFTFEASKAIISGFISMFVGQFKSVAKIIEGALTLDWGKVKDGAKDYGKAVKDGVGDAWDGITDAADKAGKEMANTLRTAVANTMAGDKVEFVTEDDIQGSVDDIGNWFSDKLGKVKDKISGFMGGTSLGVPEGGGGTPSPEGGGGGGAMEAELETQKTALQSYLDWAEEGYEKFAGKVGEVWGEISKHAGAVLGGIGDMWAAEHEKKMTLLANEQTVEEEKMASDMERDIAKVEMSKMNEEQKEAALLAIKDKYDGKQLDLDKKFGEKKKELEVKQAKREKAMKVAQAIMATAQAVVQALTAGPIAGPILAGLMAGLGAAQVAAIASTPLPMAKGGIAYGPTNALVGEYPGAGSDPEVVAPLSKLKSLLGNEMNVSLAVGGMLKGEDIFLSNDETTDKRQRYI